MVGPVKRDTKPKDQLDVPDKSLGSGKTPSNESHVPTKEELNNWYTVEPVHLPPFIFYLCKYIMVYETIIFVLLIANLAMFPFDAFFNTHDPHVANFVYYLDIFFGVDVILRLAIEEWRHYTATRCMVFMFPYALHYCVLDIISLFPFYRIPLYFKGKENLTFDDLGSVEWWKIPLLLRIYRIRIYYRELEKNGLLYEAVIFVVKFLMWYLIFILLVTVVFFWLTHLDEIEFFLLTRDQDKILNSWAQNFHEQELVESSWGFFVLTFTFSTIVVTTVGYGDIVPTTEGEMAASIVVMLYGAVFLSGFFQSKLTSFCLQLDGARLDLFHRLDGIRIALHQANMGDFFIAKVEQYYEFLWTYREGVDRVLFFNVLPHSFQEDILFDICLEMFHKSYLFRGLDEAFLRSVSKKMVIALYNPGMVVCRYGGYANRMYYIIQGECQAMSKHDTAKRSAILRAGSIIGETNLFFSSPYAISIETKSCCQLMSLDKEDLMEIFNKFETELQIMRSRCQKKINDMYYFYEKKGSDPVCWVEIRPEANDQFISKTAGYKRSTIYMEDGQREPEWPNFTMRWGYGFNDLITEDVVLDAEEFVIFDAPCDDKAARKNHATPYMTCVLPEILNSDITLIKVWNITILICALLYGFYGPYCLAFNTSSLIEQYMCKAGGIIEYINDIVYLVDVLVEIYGASPVEGAYYKFKDGLKVKKTSLLFYLDCLAAFPLSFFQHMHEAIQQANVIIKSTKIWKSIRYLNYMDNVHPKHVFWFRLMQTCLVLVYGIHFIACAIYIQACPKLDEGIRNCLEKDNWLKSYQLREGDGEIDDSKSVKTLSTKNPYLISFFYSSATLTSAGFGDFSPQNQIEMIWAALFTLIGFFIINYYTSVLTSALSCIVKPKLEFQQKLVAVTRFMDYYSLPDSLQRRVLQFYELQHQARHGINLPHGIEHFLFDAPDYLKNDYLYTDTVLLFDGIPLFSKVEPKYVIKMADVMRRYVIPPNVTFLHVGEVRRAMYLIQAGSVGVYGDDMQKPIHILEGTAHFGIRDCLFGEPSHYSIRTLSFCNMYEITNDNFVEVFEEEEELLDLIEDEREARHDEIENMYHEYSQIEREQNTEGFKEIPSWIVFRPTKDNRGDRGRKFVEYEGLFTQFRGGTVFKHFLENRSVHPVGKFAKWWSCWMSLVSCLTIMLLFVETYMYLRTPSLRLCEWLLDSFFYVDIYIKLHWGYYQSKTGIMISHPLKTAGVYIFEGSFFTDVVFCTPLELLMAGMQRTTFLGYGEGGSWYTKLRWIRFLQIKRIPQIFEIVHGIFVWRTTILFCLFVSLTLVVCSIVGAVALSIACPWEANDWQEGDENRLPACSKDFWANTKFEYDGENDYGTTERVLADITKRWIFGLYYVSQVLLVIGFGDMITLNPAELKLLILMSVFGFVFLRCVIADMTAAEVDSDEIRSTYTEEINALMTVMVREKINKKLRRTAHDHLNNMWKRTKGLQPSVLFRDLHPSLESDVFRSYIGDTLRKVAVFQDFTPNVTRTLCLYLRKVHFLKGERIMKYGNLDYEMYVIVNGKVWITDRRLSYGCTLGKHETFGESSMLTYHPRRYNGIAATNLEAYVISRHDFDALIDRYPKVKDILNALLSNGEYDYFEYKIYEMIDRLKELADAERDHQIDLMEARTNEIKSVLSVKDNLSEEEAGDWRKASARNAFYYLLSKVVGSGSDDDSLPFFYFVGRRNKITGKYSVFPPLIHPNCGFIKFYFTVVHTLCLLSPALAMYEFAFSRTAASSSQSQTANADEKIQTVIHVIGIDAEYFFLTYILVKLMTPFQNDRGFYVKDFLYVAVNYIFAWDGIWLDLAAGLPGFAFQAKSLVLLASRSLRLYRYYSYYMSGKDDLSVSSFRLKIQISFSTFILMAHFIACMFYYISDCEGDSSHPCVDLHREEAKLHMAQKNPPAMDSDKTFTWTRKFCTDQDITTRQDVRMHRWRWWLRALYWVVTVISTTGFGDITPQNEEEMMIGIGCFFAGAFVLSIILSNFTAGMTLITRAHREYLYQVKLLLKYLKNVGLSNIRQNQTNQYFNALWDKCRGRLYHEVTAILPATLRIEVCDQIYGDVLKQSFLFNINNPYFIPQVAARVAHSIYLPGTCIVKEGDLGDTMYMVFRGHVGGVIAHGTDLIELKKVYLVGDVFGKLPCLFHNEYYRKSYRAEEVTEVLELRSRDILHLASLFPQFWKLLKAFVEVTYDPNGESDCIFSPQKAKQKNIFDLGEDYKKKHDDEKKHKDRKEAVHHHHPEPPHHTPSYQNMETQHDSHAQTKQRKSQPHGTKSNPSGHSAKSKKGEKDKKGEMNPIPFLHDSKRLSVLKMKVDSSPKMKSAKSEKSKSYLVGKRQPMKRN